MIVSIIIPTYNSLPKLQRALRSLESVDFPRDSFEVVVVDDGSADQTHDFLSQYVRSTPLAVQHFHQNNRGPAAARNLAIRHARGDYLLSIDSDCYVDKNILKAHLEHFPRAGLAGAGGEVLPEGNSLVSRYLDYIGVWRPGILDGEVRYIVTANAFFCKKALLDVGGFDEDFSSPGGEEPEMCHRLRKKGYFFIYEQKAVVMHAHRTSFRGLVRMFRTHGIGCGICAEKWDCFSIAEKTIRGNLFGKTLPNFFLKASGKVGPASAAAFSILEYVRMSSYYSGYKLRRRDIRRKL